MILSLLFIQTDNVLLAQDKHELYINLYSINLKNQPLLREIIKEVVTDEDAYSDKVTFYTLDLSDNKDGILLHFVAHTKKKLFYYNGYTGYVMADTVPIIFDNKSSLRLHFIPNHFRNFLLSSPDTPPTVYDPDEWYYLIVKNNYAKYVFGEGWVWKKPVITTKKFTDPWTR